MTIDCLNNPNYYRTIDHLQIVENSGKIYGVFERYKDDPNYDGICYFEYDLNNLLPSGGNPEPADLSSILRDAVNDTRSRVVPSSLYGYGRLRKLYLDVDMDINITFIPFNKRKVNNDCIFFGIINQGVFVGCPSAPINTQGKVKELFTFYKRGNGVVHPVKIYHLERCESDDKIECNVDNQGHWGQWH